MNNNPTKKKILQFLKKRRGGCKMIEASAILEINHSTVKGCFSQLKREGLIEKVTYGRYKLKEE